MKIYLVGGAVRDQLLHLPVKEKDWVVVGATVDEMLKLGFKQVGKDFPVFLHPQTKEEYALARTERKIGRGYTGFSFDASPDVSLEDDLKRRDFTINAMAETPEGVLIDPYHGKTDLTKKILRHVSPAFSEDPVRILRAARFAARYKAFGFSFAPETISLMKQMVQSGEVDALVAERVWKEFERALQEKNPEQFFIVLKDCDAMRILFPDIGAEGIDALIRATKISSDARVRFAALMQHLSAEKIDALCHRYRVPRDYSELAHLASKYSHISTVNADEMLQLLQNVDAFRREERFKNFLLVCTATNTSPAFIEKILQCYTAAKKITAKEFIDAGISGKELAEKINQKRKDVIQLCLT